MKVGFTQLVQFQKRMQKLDEKIKNDVCKKVANGLAAKLLKQTKEKTPVGQYPKGTGKVGGTLKRGWKTKGVKLPNGYKATVFNQVEYAPYVEFGHRIVNKNGKTVGFVQGRHMLTKSTEEIARIADDYAQKTAYQTIKEAIENWKLK